MERPVYDGKLKCSVPATHIQQTITRQRKPWLGGTEEDGDLRGYVACKHKTARIANLLAVHLSLVEHIVSQYSFDENSKMSLNLDRKTSPPRIKEVCGLIICASGLVLDQ